MTGRTDGWAGLAGLAVEQGGMNGDDVLAALLPLFGQVAALHADGLVAPLGGPDALVVDDRYRVTLAGPGVAPVHARAAVAKVQREQPGAVDIVGRAEWHTDLATGVAQVHRLDVVGSGDVPDRPCLTPGWRTWEHLVGQHDALSDVADLGLLLAGLACGLDLDRREDVERLAEHRANLFRLNPRLHPVLAQVAGQMLEPDRRLRAQDVAELAQRLETYRDQPLDFDLADVAAGARDRADRRKAVLVALRDRLYDLSRRNRLLYFKPTAQSLNLTEASVPLLLDARNVRAEQLFTWRPDVEAKLLSGRPLSLGSVLRWEDAPYASAVLDTLISTARRDRAEYGVAQLRLVVAFLRWHDLKGEPDERISSPLVLLPVTVSKKRGVRDSYLLQAEGSVAEVNPTLRQHLRQLYGLTLPETLDLRAGPAGGAVAELHADLQRQIAATEPGVTLRLQDRPRIELVHRQAQLRLDAFNRRSARGRIGIGRRSYAYSYARRDFRPLGLQIFRDRVQHASPELSLLFGAAPPPRTSVADPERATYVLDRHEQGNPYQWDVDLCALTLANVNYRTVSLVRDVNELIGTQLSCAAFEQVFSLEPRALAPPVAARLPLEERYLVVPGDASQLAAIAKVREGASFVIQGPPGTGKSQTITNLIADCVADGRRVLFVSQKRAAIDVVHARLRERGLDELSCLIHDSQADKKAFVLGLKQTYESWLASGDDTDAAEQARRDLVAAIGVELNRVRGYEEAAAAPGPGGGPSARELLDRLIGLHASAWPAGATPAVRRLLPSAAQWWAARPVVDEVARALVEGGSDPVLARSPVRFLSPAVLAELRPDAEAAARAVPAGAAVRDLLAALAAAAPPGEPDSPRWPDEDGPVTFTLETVTALGELGRLVLPLAARGRAAALRPGTATAEALHAAADAWRAAQRRLAEAQAVTANWTDPLEESDARAALGVARDKEGSALRFLSGSWRRVRRSVHARCDTSGRAVPPTVGESLALLVGRYDAEHELARLAAESGQGWGHADPAALLHAIGAVRLSDDPVVRAAAAALARTERAEPAEGFAAVADVADRLRQYLDGFLVDVDDLPLSGLLVVLDALADPGEAPEIRALVGALRELDPHPEVAAALRRLEAAPDQLEHAVAAAALDEARAAQPGLARFTGTDLAQAVDRAQALLPRLYAADAAVVVARVRRRFLAAVQHAARSVTGMSPEERAAKKTWSTGRRELEHEFGKTRAYRSIRDLASGEPGAVVAALRPIWLMGPTAVSDAMPLDPDLFDVVVYDEASQIPLEEAVPAMHRAQQVVVVGDQMQLPPAQYFAAHSDEPDADPDGQLDEEDFPVVLDADSFLAQSATRLPSTMLTWHYRSRFETLIGFSNAAFYHGRLATVPDRAVVVAGRPPLEADVAEADAAGGDASRIDPATVTAAVDGLLGRSISLHRMRGAPYRRRTNAGEAAYIAALVRELLIRETGLTLGIVAFSQAQQAAIEAALERLADADPLFARAYERELAREVDERFVGLFVKNLENVQGDERDVMLVSVCYGPDADGRMVMNFGPINTRGGEKRLNVIFSRAREHMAIVTSIDPPAITNTYNDGANTLRQFLAYAGAVSRGDDPGAASVLAAVGGPLRPADPSGPGPVATQLAEALRQRGVEVAEQVGRSAFRCDLALREPGDTEHRVAVLIDTPQRVGAEQAEERVLSHPTVLQAAGWRVAHVLTKDWYDDPGRVVAFLERQLRG